MSYVNINFKKKRPPIKCIKGSNLMQVLKDAGLPVASSCGGQGVCSKCVLEIVEGHENLNSKTAEELKFLKQDLSHFSQNNIYRLACQAIVLGDIAVDASYW